MAIVAVWLALGASSALAASAWDLIAPKDLNANSKVQRDAIARDLKMRVGLFVELLGEQSAQDVRQLERDEAILAEGSGDVRDRTELQLSALYQHRQLMQRLQAMSRALDCVVASTQLAPEMYCWAQAALLLSDEESLRLALSTLRSARRLPPNKDMPALVRSPEVWYTTYGRGIFEFIVTPYLARVAASEAQP
jgi:hypothetical protein